MKRKYFGIVEGFFSEPLKPWTIKERQNTTDFINKYASSINTYIYCPKDDPYVTRNWDLAYPKSKQNELKILFQTLLESNISCFFGLNPTIKAHIDWNTIKLKTIKKLDSILALGCRNICLLFDDIPLAYDVIDNTINEKVTYDDFISYVNYIYEYYKNSIDDFWICLPDYNFTRQTALTQSSKKLNKNIAIMWSGNQVFSKKVTKKDILRVKKILLPEVRLIYWSNYPVNDCEQAIGTFNLGGFYPINQSVLKALSGIIVNPMREAYANFPFYITYADYIQEKQKYSRKNSWGKSLKKLGLSYQDIKILSLFSNVNLVDNKKLYKPLLPQKVKEYNRKLDNTWGYMFVKSVQSLFRDAEIFVALSEELLEDNNININKFVLFDWFPTKTYIARYSLEILSIVQKRYGLYKNYLPQQSPFTKQIKTIESFNKKYPGQKKLTIIKSDIALLLQNINTIILNERRMFLSTLQSKNISPQQKIRLLYERRNINRFTIDK